MKMCGSVNHCKYKQGNKDFWHLDFWWNHLESTLIKCEIYLSIATRRFNINNLTTFILAKIVPYYDCKLENQSLVLTNVTLSCSIWCTKHFTLKLTLVKVESNNRYSSSEKVLEDPPSLHRVNFYHSKSRLGQFFEILVFRVLDYWLSNFVVGFYEHLVKSR